jgi:hypothetical protein
MIQYIFKPNDEALLEKAYNKFHNSLDIDNVMLYKDNMLITNARYPLDQCLVFDDQGKVVDGYCIVDDDTFKWNNKSILEHLVEALQKGTI